MVAQLDRPSGNVTGTVNLEASLGGKWLALLSEIAPGLKRAAIMFNPDTTPASAYMPSLETAARSLKLVAISAPVHSDAEIEAVIIASGLVVIPDGFTLVHGVPLLLAAARNNVPAVFWLSVFARESLNRWKSSTRCQMQKLTARKAFHGVPPLTAPSYSNRRASDRAVMAGCS
jgi:putative ABC transport system substrate-binding protein